MNNIKIVGVVLLGLVAYLIPVLGNGQTKKVFSKGALPQEQEQIREVLKKYNRSIDNLDLKLASSIWLNSETASFIHPRGHEKGYKNVVENFYKGTMGLFSQRKLHIQEEKTAIQVVGEVAWVEFYWDFEAVFKDGKPLTSQGRETQVLRKMNNTWRIAHVHYSGLPVTGQGQGF